MPKKKVDVHFGTPTPSYVRFIKIRSWNVNIIDYRDTGWQIAVEICLMPIGVSTYFLPVFLVPAGV